MEYLDVYKEKFHIIRQRYPDLSVYVEENDDEEKLKMKYQQAVRSISIKIAENRLKLYGLSMIDMNNYIQQQSNIIDEMKAGNHHEKFYNYDDLIKVSNVVSEDLYMNIKSDQMKSLLPEEFGIFVDISPANLGRVLRLFLDFSNFMGKVWETGDL